MYLAIKDNGKGFNYKELLKKTYRRKEDKLQLGLQGFRERMELLGGKLSVRTSPGRGTKIEVELEIA